METNSRSSWYIALIGHEFVHTTQYQYVPGFMYDYVQHYNAGKDAGLSDFDAYERIVYEQVARNYASDIMNDLMQKYNKTQQGQICP